MTPAIKAGEGHDGEPDRVSETSSVDDATEANIRRSSDELIHRLDVMRQEARDQLKFVDIPSRLTCDDVDLHDQGVTAEANRFGEIDDAIRETALHALDQIEATLVRVRHGTYGRCVSCGTSIPQARLHAVPTASHCRSCKSTLEKHRSPAFRV